MLAKPSPTSEQTFILDQARTTEDNLMIRALAGTGKTATLGMIEETIDGPILCLAFNKRIAEEMEKRFKSTTSVRTFNSLGHRIWARANAKNLSLDPKKSSKLLAEIIRAIRPKDAQAEAWASSWEVIQAVGLAKALGYVPEGIYPNAKRLIKADIFWRSLEERPSEVVKDLVNSLLAASIRAAYEGYIDYNDQIYMPALFGGTFPRFPLVLVDEAQDLSPTNHQMLEKLCKGRVIAVGDPYQSIYGFRGAATSGMARMAIQHSMSETNLSISFRCLQAIVENVKWRVPWFKWNKGGGHVSTASRLDIADFIDGSAIICRNNAPLFRLAFLLLTSGRSIRVAGSDMGPKLVGTMRKLGSADTPRAAVLDLIQQWLDAKSAAGSTTAEDTAACMRIFANHGATLGQAVAYVDYLFAQEGTINLLTGHKAKGLEFDTVYHLDPWLVARAEEQEQNLKYVIETRSRENLYYINSGDIHG
jgi:DNA helicase II / ATP-dependent DNA helicase PcrA